jgi:hypothetical protein
MDRLSGDAGTVSKPALVLHLVNRRATAVAHAGPATHPPSGNTMDTMESLGTRPSRYLPAKISATERALDYRWWTLKMVGALLYNRCCPCHVQLFVAATLNRTISPGASVPTIRPSSRRRDGLGDTAAVTNTAVTDQRHASRAARWPRRRS